MSELRDLIDRHCHQSLTSTAVSGLILSRSCQTTTRSAFVYRPLLCVVAQGRKRVQLGSDEFFYDPDCFLVASLGVPASAQVVDGPCLGLSFILDTGKLAEVAAEMPPGRDRNAHALGVHRLDEDLLDSLLRLLRLLDRPQDIGVMAPLVERELYYRLLQGPRGAQVRQLARPQGQFEPIQKALEEIRRHYDEPLRVPEIARRVGMSPTSFHRHFRAVTAMSPVQFVKSIRLHEARRLLLSTEIEVARAAQNVGYESPSQFSREYRRLFGVAPSRDRWPAEVPADLRASVF